MTGLPEVVCQFLNFITFLNCICGQSYRDIELKTHVNKIELLDHVTAYRNKGKNLSLEATVLHEKWLYLTAHEELLDGTLNVIDQQACLLAILGGFLIGILQHCQNLGIMVFIMEGYLSFYSYINILKGTKLGDISDIKVSCQHIWSIIVIKITFD